MQDLGNTIFYTQKLPVMPCLYPDFRLVVGFPERRWYIAVVGLPGRPDCVGREDIKIFIKKINCKGGVILSWNWSSVLSKAMSWSVVSS